MHVRHVGYPTIIFDQDDQLTACCLRCFAFIDESRVFFSANVRSDLVHARLRVYRDFRRYSVITEWQLAPHHRNPGILESEAFEIMFASLLSCVLNQCYHANGSSSSIPGATNTLFAELAGAVRGFFFGSGVFWSAILSIGNSLKTSSRVLTEPSFASYSTS